MRINGLTQKQHKFVEGIVQGKTQAESYKQAYDVAPTTKMETIYPEASKTTRLPQVQDALRPFLNKHNITVDRALKPVSEALEAETMNQFTGEITPNHSVRLQASDRALKLLGVTQEASHNLNLHLTDKSTTYNL